MKREDEEEAELSLHSQYYSHAEIGTPIRTQQHQLKNVATSADSPRIKLTVLSVSFDCVRFVAPLVRLPSVFSYDKGFYMDCVMFVVLMAFQLLHLCLHGGRLLLFFCFQSTNLLRLEKRSENREAG